DLTSRRVTTSRWRGERNASRRRGAPAGSGRTSRWIDGAQPASRARRYDYASRPPRRRRRTGGVSRLYGAISAVDAGARCAQLGCRERRRRSRLPLVDRKSTRLNSSHLVISYAVFCLKKKKKAQR